MKILQGEIIIQLTEPEELRLLEKAAGMLAKEIAEQEALKKVYRVNQELFDRLNMGENSVYNAIHDGRLDYILIGEKGYRIPESACRKFLEEAKRKSVSFTGGNSLRATG